VRMRLAAVALVISAVTTQAAPVLWDVTDGGNDHWYEIVSTPYVTWDAAKLAAAEMSWCGLTGHLATFTSLPEWDFYMRDGSLRQGGLWLGGFRPEGWTEPTGGWQWITGEAWDLDWMWGPFWPTEPYEGENALRILWNPTSGWRNANSQDLLGMVVEYEGSPVDTPELPSASLLLLGMLPVGLAWRRRRSRQAGSQS
jgi:hypothetical protein